MKKLALVASFIVAVALSLQFGLPSAASAAHKKIDCAKVMEELNSGKKVAEVAKDMKISRSSVYRCRRIAKKEAKAKASPAATPGASEKK